MLARLLTLFSFLVFTTAANAVMVKPFDQPSFDEARNDGKPLLVMVHASWCPTCRAQAKAVDALMTKPEFANFQILRVDYDKQKGFVDLLRAPRQSVLIVYKGKTEVARSLGETDQEAIAAMLRKAL
ncbi:MAG TPA: thioredoxin family protein [Methylophilaceae bacterium]|jgi:thiol-disulfide isomerase/thioredoxin